MIPMSHLLHPSLWVKEQTGIRLDLWQQEALDCPTQYQAWCCSRQTGKSTTAAERTAWQVMTRNDQLVLLFSNSLRQSQELFRKVLKVYKEVEEGPKRTDDNSYSLTLDNGSRVLSLPGSEESILGFTPNLVIIDEAAVVSEKFFKAVNPMLAVSHGSLILASTPRGKRGFFWDVWKNKDEPGSQWKTFSVVAEQCPRIEAKFLEQQLNLLGPDWFEQEYHCKFLEVSGTLFSDDMISAIFTDDGFVIDPGAFGMNLLEEGYGWQAAFEAGVASELRRIANATS
jgi:hypothetical protein